MINNLFSNTGYLPLFTKKKPNADEYAERLNTITYYSILQRTICIASRRFKWNNLPEGIPEWFIEWSMFWNESVGAAIDRNIGEIILPANNAGTVNIYGIPVEYNLIGTGYNERFKLEDCAILRDNFLGTSMFFILEPLINNVYESMRTRDMNLQNNKMPIFYSTSNKTKLTVENVFKKIQNNVIALFTGDTIRGDTFTAIPAIPPYIVDKLDTHIQDAWNDIYTVLGIQTQNIEKRERVQAAEVYASVEQNQIFKHSAIECRERWCEECNKKFGWNISVEWLLPEIPLTTLEGGENDGFIYDDSKGNAGDDTTI